MFRGQKWKRTPEASKYIRDGALANTLVVFIACVNKRFQTLQYEAASSERQTKAALSLPGALRRRRRKTPVISLDDGNPTGARFK